MPWVYTQGSEAQLQSIGDRVLELLRKRGVQAMERVMVQALEDARRLTDRVDTGDMLESLMQRTLMEGADRIIGEFGFLGRKDLYFALQTSTGFKHYISGEFIAPTLALQGAAQIAIQNLLKELGA